MIPNQFKVSIKVLRTDNGPEFALYTFYASKVILHQLSLFLFLLPLLILCFHVSLQFQSPFLLFLQNFLFLSVLLTQLCPLMSFQILFILIWNLLHLSLILHLFLLLLLLPCLICQLLGGLLGLINLLHTFMIITAILLLFMSWPQLHLCLPMILSFFCCLDCCQRTYLICSSFD
ncbi:hypothetical protein ACB092_05G196100 [Castanea dentata]